MPIAMRVHSTEGGKVPGTRRISQVNGQTFVTGAVLVYNAGQVQEGGVNPTEIIGIALQGADTNPGFGAANSPSVITGRVQAVTVAIASSQVTFAASLTNGSSTLVAPTQADVGAQYGITAYSGIWTVDKNKTAGNARVEVVGFDVTVYSPGIVFFKFLASVLSNQ